MYRVCVDRGGTRLWLGHYHGVYGLNCFRATDSPGKASKFKSPEEAEEAQQAAGGIFSDGHVAWCYEVDWPSTNTMPLGAQVAQVAEHAAKQDQLIYLETKIQLLELATKMVKAGKRGVAERIERSAGDLPVPPP